MADILSFVLKADNKASPEFQKVALDVKKLETTVKAWGTGTQAARSATSQLLDTLRASRGAADTAAGGFAGANKAARDFAQGGVRELASQVPVAGGALAKLAGTLSGFPLILAGVVGAGVGVIKFLQDLNDNANKSLSSVTALAEGIGQKLRLTLLEVAKIRADAAGDAESAARLASQKQIQILQDERDTRVRLAKEAMEAERDSLTALPNPGDVVALGGVGAELKRRKALEDRFRQESLGAEADFQLKKKELGEQLTADLGKQSETQAKNAAKAREDEVKAAEAAAEKQKALMKDLTASSLATFKELGAGFEDVVKSLELAQFVTKSQEAIAELEKAQAQGIDTTGRFSEGIAALTKKMQEAIALGYVPTTQAVKETTAAVEQMAVATEDAGERWLKSLEGISPALAEIAARAMEAAKAVSSAGGGAGGGPNAGGGVGPTGLKSAQSGVLPGTESLGGGTGTVLGGIVNQPSGSGLTPFNPAFNLPHFAKGGVVPGPIGKPVLATVHGGETVIPAGGGGSVTVNLQVVNQGTVVQQERDWSTYLEMIRQGLGLN